MIARICSQALLPVKGQILLIDMGRGPLVPSGHSRPLGKVPGKVPGRVPGKDPGKDPGRVPGREKVP